MFRQSETERRAFARRYNCTTLVRSFTKSLMLYIIRHSQVGSPRLRGKDNLRGPRPALPRSRLKSRARRTPAPPRPGGARNFLEKFRGRRRRPHPMANPEAPFASRADSLVAPPLFESHRRKSSESRPLRRPRPACRPRRRSCSHAAGIGSKEPIGGSFDAGGPSWAGPSGHCWPRWTRGRNGPMERRSAKRLGRRDPTTKRCTHDASRLRSLSRSLRP